MDMGQKIKNLREQKGMTLEELGNQVGVGKSTVRKWETGMIANMKRDKIAKLAKALDSDPSYLMGWSDDSNTTQSTITNSAVVQGNNASTLIVKNGNVHEQEISEQAVELIRIFESLTVKEQTELLSFAYKLEEKHNK